ncbi:MAG: histidine kinase [Saprospiraceae bacterium]|nr:histidine kinase [Lewinella sp.]
MNFKLNINAILPLALAIFLPVLNLVSNRDWSEVQANPGQFIYRWIFTVVILYFLWYNLQWVTRKGKEFRWINIIGVLLLVLGISYLSVSLFFPVEEGIKWQLIIKFCFATTLMLIIQYALHANSNISRLELEKEQMQTENYKVQLEALRAKVDPHFLFNSLNTLRTMVRNHHEQSEQFVLSLSDFYRHTLNYNETTTIPLRDELTVLNSYLFLMKSRNENAFNVSMEIDPDYEQLMIPTLALQSVVENCFKHNTMTSNHPLNIEILSTGDHAICVKNNIQPKLAPAKGSGFGLENIKRRYELLRVPRGVEVNRKEATYEVSLKLI